MSRYEAAIEDGQPTGDAFPHDYESRWTSVPSVHELPLTASIGDVPFLRPDEVYLGLWEIGADLKADRRGSLSVLEFGQRLGFVARRLFIANFGDAAAAGVVRAEHAVSCAQLFVVLGGSFRIDLDNGRTRKSLLCREEGKAALLAPGVWRRLISLEAGSRMLVLADSAFADTRYFPTPMPDLVERYATDRAA